MNKAFWVLVGTLVVLVFVALACYKVMQNADRLASYRERDQKERAALALHKEVVQRIKLAFEQHLSLSEFEKQFGNVSELSQKQKQQESGATHSFTRETSGTYCHLNFADGTLQGYSCEHHHIGDTLVLESPQYKVSESARQWILACSALFWFVALILAVAVPRWKPYAATVLVFLAVLVFLCWFLAPNYSPTWRGVSSNDKMAFGFPMFLVSFAVCFFAFGDRSRCAS